MRGSFRRDLEVARERTGLLRFRRKRGARMSSVALAVVSIAAGLFDVFVHRPWVAAVQLAMAAAFLLLLLRAELESWRFDGTPLGRRTLSLWRGGLPPTPPGGRRHPGDRGAPAPGA